MSKTNTPVLYVKTGCPWCREALSYFDQHGVDLEVRDVSNNPKDMDAMVAISGQTKAPTFEYEEFIVADFSVDEFQAELANFPEMQQNLGIFDS